MITKFNLSKPEKYTSNGVEKTYWANVGTLTEFTKADGSVSRIVEIPAIGLKAHVFDIKPKTATGEQPNKEYAGEATPEELENMNPVKFPDTKTDEIHVKDVPF